MNLLGCMATVGAGRFSGVPVLEALMEGKGNSSSGVVATFWARYIADLVATWKGQSATDWWELA